MIGRGVIAVVAAWSSMVPAAAQDFTLKKKIGEWVVYRHDDDCWMRKDLANGTSLAFSTAQTYTDLFIKLRNESWASVTDGSTYVLRVQFGSIDETKTAYGSSRTSLLPPGVGIFLNELGDGYIDRLEVSTSIRITMDGKVIVDTPLTGSDTNAAFEYLRRCTMSMRGD
ncbi:MAG: hypothetical protein E7773_05930 [Sphingomonas sp.]|uniref:hypothetical protein n=1 Tax=Sphingomonas sp. TaxID=28214 RepID=UPI0012212E59|nr:hypothetical protein [Sphingomonas sp.]THD36549.1 MAG: hypothetical protein E7773_05930 [Sphingomonas sp.]